MRIIPLKSNLISDASFEWDFDSYWERIDTTATQAFYTQERARSGRQSLKMTGGIIEVRASKFKSVTQGVNHCFLIHYYTDDLALITLNAIYYDSTCKVLQSIKKSFEPSKGDWFAGWEFFTASENATDAKVGIITVGGTGYIDDVWFGESTG